MDYIKLHNPSLIRINLANAAENRIATSQPRRLLRRMTDELRSIKIPGRRLRNLATSLLKIHPLQGSSASATCDPTILPPVEIVCISDSHNKQPDLPPGDVLIHAGDLTENGSFDEIQTNLTWLSSQPHKHKILISGNHDVLLDAEFLEQHPKRRYGQTKSAADLDWGSAQYLKDTSTTLAFQTSNSEDAETRQLKIFGSPWTPRYGISAFQYPREEDIWSDRIPEDIDILVTHGPPRLYLDTTGIHKAGCVFLAKEISRIRPRLVVFGHIHAAYGRQNVALDASRQLYDDIINQWGGYWTLAQLAVAVFFTKLQVLLCGIGRVQASERLTTFVNASVVGGPQNELKNEPIVIII